LLADGSESSPALSFSSDDNTGIYKQSENQIGFTNGGTLSVVIDSDNNTALAGNDLIDVGGTASASSGAIRLANNESIYARNSGDSEDFGITFDSSDNVSINTSLNLSDSGAIKDAATDALTFDGTGKVTAENGLRVIGELTANDIVGQFDVDTGTGSTIVQGSLSLSGSSTTFYSFDMSSSSAIRVEGNSDASGNFESLSVQFQDSSGNNSVQINDGTVDTNNTNGRLVVPVGNDKYATQ
jgi:hypothetical protein